MYKCIKILIKINQLIKILLLERKMNKKEVIEGS